jgi:Zn-dependent M16 (insulinase) family peptidase
MSKTAFELVGRVDIPSLRLALEDYRHHATGARHLHLDAEDGNNAFLVGFLTVPENSTGVAHILEHTTLCGSDRFPVRDPFFMMLRRSLSTFMNAFTASDWTAYPFASRSRRDFNNLLQVYLDAVFFPRLDKLDFAQEGCRIEFAEPEDAGSDLVYRGVVYNEMKGAMSAPLSRLAHSAQSSLFPTVTYHFNSGGEPEHIPELTHEELKRFHARHYHPSNAVFMTYGNTPASIHQDGMEQWALSRFDSRSISLAVPDERRYTKPMTVRTAYPVDDATHESAKTHIILGWLLGRTTDARATMNARLLAGVLLDHGASPLRQALETTTLGSAPSELCGFDDSTRETTFLCGLEGSEPEREDAVQALVLQVLERVADEGVPREQTESVLHQLELSQREIRGGQLPYGLQLVLRALPTVLHGGDPADALDIDPVLGALRQDIQDPQLVKRLTRDLLLDNPHRVRLTMVPDRAFSARSAAALAEHLASVKAGLGEDDRQELIALALALRKRQQSEDDPEILPRVGLDDVPEDIEIPSGHARPVNDMTGTWFAAATNGLVYQQLVLEIEELPEHLTNDLPLFCECVTEVGCGKRDYLETQAWQAAVTGGISAQLSVRASIQDLDRIRALFVLRGKALLRNQQAAAELLQETLLRARFDELPRLRELVTQLRFRQESQLTDHGHLFAMTAAMAGMGPCGALAHRWDGLAALERLKALDASLADEKALAGMSDRLCQLRDFLLGSPRQVLVVSEAEAQQEIGAGLSALWASFPTGPKPNGGFTVSRDRFRVQQGWSTSTEVNFCATAFPTVPYDHPDAPALTVLGPFLRNGFLHRAVRETGGAYGASANYDADAGAFGFSSYRDPRLAETLADFETAVSWVQQTTHQPRELEEAILSVISQLDRPDSPAGEALRSFFASLHGRDPQRRRQFRRDVLNVSLADLQRVAARYLKRDSASVAVLSSAAALAQADQLGLDLHSI